MLFLGSDEHPAGIPIPPYPSSRPIAKADRRQMMFTVPGAGINTRYISMGADDPGIPIPAYPSSIPIGPPDLHQLKFDIPGAGLESKYIGPKPIAQGPSGKIQTRDELNAPNPKAAFLDIARSKVEPIYKAMAAIKDPAERRKALDLAFGMYRPGAGLRVEQMSTFLINKGMPASAAFKDALARELAATALSTPTNAIQTVQAEGLGGVFSFLKKAAKKVGKLVKGAVGVVVAVTGAVGDIACGIGNSKNTDKVPVVGGVIGGAGKAVCKVNKKIRDVVCEVPGAKCKKKKKKKKAPEAVVVAAPAPAPSRREVPPQVRITMPRATPPLPEKSNLPIILAVGGVGLVLLVVSMQGRREAA